MSFQNHPEVEGRDQRDDRLERESRRVKVVRFDRSAYRIGYDRAPLLVDTRHVIAQRRPVPPERLQLEPYLLVPRLQILIEVPHGGPPLIDERDVPRVHCPLPDYQLLGEPLEDLGEELVHHIARMALRDIIPLPDKRLRLVSEPVKAVDADLRRLVEDMFETMYDAPGIGLAAIQVGEPRRVVTRRPLQEGRAEKAHGLHQSGDRVGVGGEGTYEEGCLSIPEYYEEVERPAQVKVKYLDLDGKAHEIAANGLLATVLQHEIDHLNGILFIDHISKLKRDRVIKKFTKAAKREGGVDDGMRLISMV